MANDRRPEDLRERTQSMPGRKNRRKWCGGRPGRSHNIVIEIPTNLPGYHHRCLTAPDWWRGTRFGAKAIAEGRDWWCAHAYLCATCGKFLRPLPPGMCPDRPRKETPR